MDSRKRLEKALSVENLDAISYFDGITYTYPHYTKVFEPYSPIKKVDSSLEPRENSKQNKKSAIPENAEEVFEDSLTRTKRKIRDYVACNIFELFVTFTFKADRQSIDHSKQKMNDWLNNQLKRSGKFKYLIVPEFHKDGLSIHFHALFKNYPGKIIAAVNPHNGSNIIKKGRQAYDIPGYRSGHVEAYKIPANPDDQARVGYYLSKYITKDMPRLFGKNRYWASHGLDLPIRRYGLPDWYKAKKVESTWDKRLEYGRVSIYLNSSLPTPEQEA